MAYALVGSAGAVSLGASPVTPAYGQSPTENNLLICWLAMYGVSESFANFPSTPSGWTLVPGATVGGSYQSNVGIYYKVAGGGDAAPTFTSTGTEFAARLAEFSGGATSSPLDQYAAPAEFAGSSPVVATSPAHNVAASELAIICSLGNYTSGTATLTNTYNNNGTLNVVQNNSTSTEYHYSFAWALSLSGSAADSNSLAISSSQLQDGWTAIASFLLYTAPAYAPTRQPSFVPQVRASSWFSRVPWHEKVGGFLAPSDAERRLVVAGG